MNPTNKEAHARAMVLKCVVAHALSTPPVYVLSDSFPALTDQQRMELDRRCKEVAAEILSSLKNAGLWSYVSPKERLFLQSAGSQMDLYAHKAATWRMECAGVLMWALGMVIDWPAIDIQMPPNLLKELDIQKIGPFTTHPPLRATEEIVAKRDLMELWHWRVRTRQLVEEGRPFPSAAEFQQAGFSAMTMWSRRRLKMPFEGVIFQRSSTKTSFSSVNRSVPYPQKSIKAPSLS